MSRERVLVIDDEQVVGLSCRRILGPEGYEVVAHEDPAAGLEAALSGEFDVILLDLVLPGAQGMDLLRKIKSAGVAAEVVIITGYSTVESAVEAMKLGAADYVCKPFSPDQMRIVLGKVCERSALLRENAALREELELRQGFEGMIGESRAMQQMFGLIRRAAPTDETVLLAGESGTGKEMAAQAIHRLSRRKKHPFLVCDCTALSPTALETELFGYAKGAFSAAGAAKPGLLESARRGTLFLDEVAGLSLEAQGKLLRVIETQRVRRLGDAAERPSDVRLLAATSRNLFALVREGAFRQDLYYRLNVLPINVPPLRQRQGDVARLAVAFLGPFCRKNKLAVEGFSPEAMTRMETYSWPGNVRELRNVVQRMAVLCDGPRIEPRHLPDEVRGAPPLAVAGPIPRTWDEFRKLKRQIKDRAVRELERRFLIEALERSGGNVSRAAEEVGIQRTNFHSLMRKYGLAAEALRGDEPGEGK